jgi:flagellar basal body-associated protein FliL
MIKLIASCVWICLLTSAAAYAAIFLSGYHAAAPPPKEQSSSPAMEFKKLPAISIPMIADGAVQGYVVAELGYTYDQNVKAPIPPDAYLLDETFRKVYSDTTLDFRHLEKYDVNAMTRDLARRVNQRLHAAVVKDVLVQALNFVPKSDIPK